MFDGTIIRRHLRLIASAMLCWLGVLLAGCGGPKVVPIRGLVKFQDESDPAPLAGYKVTFQPDEGKVGGEGTIQQDGSFAISTFGDGDGAVPGAHQVALTPPPATGEGKRPRPVIDRHYGDFSTSGLAVEVKPDQPEVTLTVKRLK